MSRDVGESDGKSAGVSDFSPENNRYATLANAVADGLFQVDADDRLVAVNDAFLDVVGRPREELLGAPLDRAFPAADAERLSAARRGLVGSDSDTVTLPASLPTTDRGDRRCEIRLRLIKDTDGGAVGSVRVSANPTEMPDDQTRTTDDQFESTLLDDLPGVVYRCANERGWPMEYVSERAVSLTGYEPAALTAGEVSWGGDIIDERDREPIWNDIQSALDTSDEFEFEYRIRTADGEAKWVAEYGRAIRDDGGEVVALEGFITDVTDDRETREQLREETEKFRSVVDSVEEYAIFMLDPEGRITSWNQGAERIKGYDAEEIVGEHFSIFYTDEDQAASVPDTNLGRATETGHCEDEGWRVRKDGSRFWANVTITPIRGDDGTLLGYAKVTRDMTEHQEHEEKLRRERDLVTRILEANPVGIAVLDDSGAVTRLNEAGAEVLGVDLGEIDEHELEEWNLFDEDGEPIAPREWPQSHVLRTGESVFDWRCEIEALDGSRRWISINAVPIRDEDSDVSRVIATAHDITSLKRQETDLRRERDLTERVLETSPVGIAVLDSQGRIVRTNGRAEELLGTTASEMEGRAYDEPEWYLWHESGEPTTPDEHPVAKVYETGEAVLGVEHGITLHDGTERWLSSNSVPVFDESGDIERVIVSFEDVTQLKEQARRLERQRDELESELEGVFDRIDDGFYAVDDALRFTYMNDWAETLLGLEELSVIGRNIRDELHLTDGFEAALQDALEGQEPVFVEDYYEPLDAWFENAIYPSGTGVSVYFRNVTKRKEREQELARFRRAVESSGHAIYMTDTDGRITYANTAFENVTGYSKEEVIGETPHILSSGKHGESYYRELWETISAGEVWEEEIIDRRKTGELYHADQTISPVFDESGEIDRFIAVQTDITERKERERELERQREELAVLNRLNEVVQETTHAIVESSSREEIEQLVCERLADSESYTFAWVGEVDRTSGTVALRTEAGVEGYLDDWTLTIDPDNGDDGPTARAIRTREPQVIRDTMTDPDYEPWREVAREYGFQSSAAIPIVYEDVLYGVLNVYSARQGAFDGYERTLLARLGNVVGHTINALERKEALMSDQVQEIDLELPGIASLVEESVSTEGTISFERTVPVGEDVYLQFGTADEEAMALLEGLVDTFPSWEELTVLDERFGQVSFELRFSEPPAISAVAAYGGRVRSAAIEDGHFRMYVELPPAADVRAVLEALRAEYPDVEIVAQRRTARDTLSIRRVDDVLEERLTDRQRAALEAAYYAGYFDTPRKQSGESVAESLDITAPTLHQHLRKGERKLLSAVFDDLEK